MIFSSKLIGPVSPLEREQALKKHYPESKLFYAQDIFDINLLEYAVPIEDQVFTSVLSKNEMNEIGLIEELPGSRFICNDYLVDIFGLNFSKLEYDWFRLDGNCGEKLFYEVGLAFLISEDSCKVHYVPVRLSRKGLASPLHIERLE